MWSAERQPRLFGTFFLLLFLFSPFICTVPDKGRVVLRCADDRVRALLTGGRNEQVTIFRLTDWARNGGVEFQLDKLPQRGGADSTVQHTD